MVLAIFSVNVFAAAGATVELSVLPGTVAPGGTVAVSGSVTNTSTPAKKEDLTVVYDIAGPCNFTDTYSYNFTLGANQTRSASVNYTVPLCIGTYTVTASVTSGGALLARTIRSFTVQ
jgi:hemolysin activation/secretion protein